MLKLNVDGIPNELKQKKHWVCFTLSAEGKKIPINPNTGSPASIAAPSTWGSFEQVAALVEQGIYFMVGYALTKEDGYIFVDLDCHLDKCSTDEEKEKLAREYKAFVRMAETIETYQEQSVSGTGIHIIAKGQLLENLKYGSSYFSDSLEMYYQNRFMIMTGHRLNEFDISDGVRVVGALQNLQRHYFNTVDSNSNTANNPCIPPIKTEIRTDDEVLKIAGKEQDFVLLWNNKWEDVKDRNGNPKFSQQHFADFQLVRKLIFYSGNCPEQAERLFKKSPCYQAYGKNGKWRKYESDIRKDIQTTSETCWAIYDPNYKKEAPSPIVLPPATVSTTVSSSWRPNFDNLLQMLTAQGDSRIFQNQALVDLLLDYVVKYKDRYDIQYYPYLFRQDKNVNGCTNIVVQVLGENLKYSPKYGNYFKWNGKKYELYGDLDLLIHPVTEILGYVEHSVVKWILESVVIESENREFLEKKAVELLRDSKKYVSTKLAIEVLKKYKGMTVNSDIADFYDTPYINCQNGLLNLETRELVAHSPKYNQAKITNCNYDPDAQCPVFLDMMERLLPNAETRKEFQKTVGLCLAKSQLPAKKIVAVLLGEKNTGKSTTLNILLKALNDYGVSIDNKLIMQSNSDYTVGPEMFDLIDTLMISTSEIDDNSRKSTLDGSRVKSLTGETTQSIRNNHGHHMTKFKMKGILFVDTNSKPFTRDEAVFSRFRIFPFNAQISKKDPALKPKLEKELDGIFLWILQGLDIVLEEQEIFETPEMLLVKEDYRVEMNTTLQFLSECVESSSLPKDKIQTTILLTAYRNWCKDNNYHDIVRNKFYSEVLKQFEKKRSGDEFFLNIKFTALGALYKEMGEQSPQQFAKAKRLLMEGNQDLPYNIQRTGYFRRSWEWFVMNIDSGTMESVHIEKYPKYVEWCIDKGLMPIKRQDYVAKVHALCNNPLFPTPEATALEKVKDIWSS